MSHPPREPFKHLEPGAAYRVARGFTDHDGNQHPVGEQWRFIGSSFLPYDDGLSLFVSVDGAQRQIRLQWRAEEQGAIIDSLADHIQPA